eukprot:3349-Chlamydomonas_euryale.AAC.1
MLAHSAALWQGRAIVCSVCVFATRQHVTLARHSNRLQRLRLCHLAARNSGKAQQSSAASASLPPGSRHDARTGLPAEKSSSQSMDTLCRVRTHSGPNQFGDSAHSMDAKCGQSVEAHRRVLRHSAAVRGVQALLSAWQRRRLMRCCCVWLTSRPPPCPTLPHTVPEAAAGRVRAPDADEPGAPSAASCRHARHYAVATP